MERIINLTQHVPTYDQMKAGVITPSDHDAVKKLLTFNELPTTEQIASSAEQLASTAAGEAFAADTKYVMIGGAPFLMAPLESALLAKGLVPLYAFSKRVSVEETQKDGSVVKRNVFKHIGFIGG